MSTKSKLLLIFLNLLIFLKMSNATELDESKESSNISDIRNKFDDMIKFTSTFRNISFDELTTYLIQVEQIKTNLINNCFEYTQNQSMHKRLIFLDKINDFKDIDWYTPGKYKEWFSDTKIFIEKNWLNNKSFENVCQNFNEKIKMYSNDSLKQKLEDLKNAIADVDSKYKSSVDKTETPCNTFYFYDFDYNKLEMDEKNDFNRKLGKILEKTQNIINTYFNDIENEEDFNLKAEVLNLTDSLMKHVQNRVKEFKSENKLTEAEIYEQVIDFFMNEFIYSQCIVGSKTFSNVKEYLLNLLNEMEESFPEYQSLKDQETNKNLGYNSFQMFSESNNDNECKIFIEFKNTCPKILLNRINGCVTIFDDCNKTFKKEFFDPQMVTSKFDSFVLQDLCTILKLQRTLKRNKN